MREEKIKTRIKEAVEILAVLQKTLVAPIAQAAELLTNSLNRGGKILLFGCGGSAADCQHIAAEFIGRFQKERRPLAAIALTTDTSSITAISNDYAFAEVFSRQLEGLAGAHDIAIGISTSGNSPSVVLAMKKAKELGLKTISLSGKGGGKMAAFSDICIDVPSTVTARIQEAHALIGHILCELVEDNLCKEV